MLKKYWRNWTASILYCIVCITLLFHVQNFSTSGYFRKIKISVKREFFLLSTKTSNKQSQQQPRNLLIFSITTHLNKPTDGYIVVDIFSRLLSHNQSGQDIIICCYITVISANDNPSAVVTFYEKKYCYFLKTGKLLVPLATAASNKIFKSSIKKANNNSSLMTAI